MSKIYKKSELVFEDGYVKKGKTVVALHESILNELKRLALCVQETEHIAAQPDHQPFPNLNEFKFDPGWNTEFEIDAPVTPVHDQYEEDKKKMIAEKTEIDIVNRANTKLMQLSLLCKWIEQDFVLYDPEEYPRVAKTKGLGNILELTVDDVKRIVMDWSRQYQRTVTPRF